MFSNILSGAAGFPVADLGDTVSQSLRFRGSQRLLGDFASTEWTISSWVKLAVRTSQVDYIWSAGTSGIAINSSAVTWYDGSNFTSSTALLRDPSAWYHIVANKDTVYLNGQTLMSITGINLSATANNFNVGAYSTNTLHLNGYQASFIAIDGQKLDPTAFGRENEHGVWVPKNYTGTYGTNGFKLTFDSSAGLGDDTSGNNNDFTANGFDTADVALYSAFCTTNTSFSSIQPASNGFDGNTGTSSDAAGATGVFTAVTFAPEPAIDITGVTVRMNSASTSSTITLGGASTSSNGGWVTVDKGTATELSSTTPIVITRNVQSGSTGFRAIEVDGTILVDNTDNDVDFLDTPTNNYATLNPLLARSASLNFEHANLRQQFGAGGSHCGMAGFGMPGSSGKYYWEVTLKVQKEGGIGIVSEDFDLENGNTSFGTDTANGGQGWEWIVSEGRRDNNNVETNTSHTSA
jgi:hypothetical protein